MKRVEGYMTRAEQLGSLIRKDEVAKHPSSGGTAELEKCVSVRLSCLWSCVCADGLRRVVGIEATRATKTRTTQK